MSQLALAEVVAGYACESCLRAIPIRWNPAVVDGGEVRVDRPESVLLPVIAFDYDHIPVRVRAEIEEALKCLAVDAFSGFAAMCRRAVQAICTELGTEASTKVERQIDELKELSGLDEETYAAVKQIMLTGHDGAHPHLPPVDEGRAQILLALLRDIVYQLFTRPGKIKAAAEKRREAIAQQKSQSAP